MVFFSICHFLVVPKKLAMASQSESVCVGLDGGATKTKTVCVVSGKVVGRAVTPASNFNSGWSRCLKSFW